MSQSTKAAFRVDTQGIARDLGAFVIGARFSADGRTLAFALGDGTVRLVAMADLDTWRTAEVHDGGILAVAADATGDGFVTGGDDGKLRRIAADGTVSDIGSFGMKWVEQVATHAAGVIAAGVGKVVHLFDAAGQKLKELVHPSTVTGLAFDMRGKRIGASHYNGVTLWFIAAKIDSPRKLEWKGSHIGIAIHPKDEAVVTAMQENALHGWALPDLKHMRMSGYPAKTLALSFSKGGKWLASSGADAMVLWPFHGGGPMGKAPTELAGGDGIICDQVACHPQNDIVAGGFADGLVVVGDIASARILPVVPPQHGPITTLAWSPDGTRLAIGTETGYAAIVDFASRG
jgi:WD40 repeat protein